MLIFRWCSTPAEAIFGLPALYPGPVGGRAVAAAISEGQEPQVKRWCC